MNDAENKKFWDDLEKIIRSCYIECEEYIAKLRTFDEETYVVVDETEYKVILHDELWKLIDKRCNVELYVPGNPHDCIVNNFIVDIGDWFLFKEDTISMIESERVNKQAANYNFLDVCLYHHIQSVGSGEKVYRDFVFDLIDKERNLLTSWGEDAFKQSFQRQWVISKRGEGLGRILYWLDVALYAYRTSLCS